MPGGANQYNTALGLGALNPQTSGSGNVAVGYISLSANTAGSYNTAIGASAMQNNQSGPNNTAVGWGALGGLETGTNNIAVGYNAGAYLLIGNNNNIDIGNFGGNPGGPSSDNGVIRIGTGGTQTSFFAAGISGVNISGAPVLVSSTGQLGIGTSSRRFKEDIHDMGDASSALMRLRPVTFRYKQAYEDGSRPVDYGLIAEEVAEVYPDLAVMGADGQIQTIQYQKLTPMLLNEVQKQHQLIEQQAETISLLQKRLEALETSLHAAR
jgi:hypothetical protein